MKKSVIFWNVMILLVELVIGLIFWYQDLGTYLMVISSFHSLFLFAVMVDDCETFNGDSYSLFLFISFFGVILLILFLIACFFLHPVMVDFWGKVIGWIPKTFDKINEKLDK
jgi:hypothetical protein